jgi:hypothetical protein
MKYEICEKGKKVLPRPIFEYKREKKGGGRKTTS